MMSTQKSSSQKSSAASKPKKKQQQKSSNATRSGASIVKAEPDVLLPLDNEDKGVEHALSIAG